jgi:hypothetical protein
MARSRMSRAESPTVVAINLRTSGHDGPTGRPSCWNRRGPSIPAAMLAVHHLRIAACLKKARRALALVATDTRPQPCFPWAARKRIYIFQGNIVERTILLAKCLASTTFSGRVASRENVTESLDVAGETGAERRSAGGGR